MFALVVTVLADRIGFRQIVIPFYAVMKFSRRLYSFGAAASESTRGFIKDINQPK
ncbi:hypothetical protein ACFOGG_04560 [Brenneria rubrifaciens]|uniref:hypothetical protein n=1 Tax=Brenneria rubrifaciens TaxID=55213 RepID=UPI00361E4A28